jgi:hypothetical protein
MPPPRDPGPPFPPPLRTALIIEMMRGTGCIYENEVTSSHLFLDTGVVSIFSNKKSLLGFLLIFMYSVQI